MSVFNAPEYERNCKCTWYDSAEQRIRCYHCSIQQRATKGVTWCFLILTQQRSCQRQMARNVYTILYGGVREVTQRFGQWTI